MARQADSYLKILEIRGTCTFLEDATLSHVNVNNLRIADRTAVAHMFNLSRVEDLLAEHNFLNSVKRPLPRLRSLTLTLYSSSNFQRLSTFRPLNPSR